MNEEILSQLERNVKALEKARSENISLRAINRQLIKNRGLSFESHIDGLREFLQEEPGKVFRARFAPVAAHKPKSAPVFDADHSETAVLVLSDFHTGETISPLEINGLNRFCPMVLANRLWQITGKFMKIVRGHQSMYKIDKIWLPVLGDMISGSIHQELALTNALLDLPSAVLASRLLILIVERLKTLGLPIEADAVVGNHARQLAKLTTKKQAHLSLDWIVYVLCEEHFRNDPQVKWTTHQSQFALVKQRGHGFVLEHNADYSFAQLNDLDNKLRGIFDNPTYREAAGVEGPSVDFVIIGDKHRGQRGPRFIANGCLPGSSEITTSWRLGPIKAEQAAFSISDSIPATWFYLLESPSISQEAENVFSDYTKLFMDSNA